MYNKNLIIITGPTASGKSTVAKMLCKKYKKAVRLDIDRVKHFIEAGFIYNESKEGKEQWKLCTKNIILLVKNYLKAGYVVVLEGVLVGKENWRKIFKEFSTYNRFLLISSKKDLYTRNAKRTEQFIMEEVDIDEHLKVFQDKFYKKYFGEVENNNLGDTVEKIAKTSQKSK